MSRLGPLYLAIAIFPLVALLVALPYVALQYRRRGTVGAGHLFLAGAFGLYLVGLAFSVILPLRPVGPDFCALYEADVHLNPLYLVDEFRTERALGGWAALAGNSDFQDVVLNVFLFIPMGLFVRHLLRKGVGQTVAIGLGVSLFIELTQVTGNWGLYPCPYRYFATSDLITNALGTGIGAMFAPALRIVPAQRTLADPGAPQPVTPLRRALAATLNATVVLGIGLVLLALAGLVLEVTRGQLFEADSDRARLLRATALVLVPGVAVMLAVPLAFAGRTPGEWAVLIRPSAPGGGPPSRRSILLRFLAGAGPLVLLAAFGVLGADAAWIAFAAVAGLQLARIVRAGEGEEIRAGGGVTMSDSR